MTQETNSSVKLGTENGKAMGQGACPTRAEGTASTPEHAPCVTAVEENIRMKDRMDHLLYARYVGSIITRLTRLFVIRYSQMLVIPSVVTAITRMVSVVCMKQCLVGLAADI